MTLYSSPGNTGWWRGSWSDDGRIVFDTWNAGLRVVSADGGPVRELTAPSDEWHLAPEVIAGTTTVLFFSQREASFQIEAIDLDGSGRRVVLDNGSQPRALASGHLLFERDGGLMVAPFDRRAVRVTGPAVPLALDPMVDDVRLASPVPQLAVAQNGTLVFAPPNPTAKAPSELVSVDRAGRRERIASVPYFLSALDLSPDGTQLALSGRDGNRESLTVFDLGRRTLTPLRDEQVDMPTGPVFSADGKEVFFARYGTHRGEILAQALDGGSPRLVARLEGTWITPYSASHDGRWLVGMLFRPGTSGDVWAIDLAEMDPARAVRSILAGTEYETAPNLSPDGGWLAYALFDSQGSAIYLQRFPYGESRVRVSPGLGTHPRWSPDGRELYYWSPTGESMTAVAVELEPKVRLGLPREVLVMEERKTISVANGNNYAIARDGRILLLSSSGGDPRSASELVVVENWFREIRELPSASGSSPRSSPDDR